MLLKCLLRQYGEDWGLGPLHASQCWYLHAGSPCAEVESDAEAEYALQIFLLFFFPCSFVLSLPCRVLEQLYICGLHPYKKWEWDRPLLVSVRGGQRYRVWSHAYRKNGTLLGRRIHVINIMSACWCLCPCLQNYSWSKENFCRQDGRN